VSWYFPISYSLSQPSQYPFYNINESGSGLVNNLFYGLIFALFGDILLLERSTQRFLQGLIAFLISHIFYIYAFSTVEWLLPSVRFGFILALGTFYTVMIAFLLFKKKHKQFVLPVFFYQSTITFMTIMAVNLDHNMLTPYASWGAMLFMLSDSLICWDKWILKIAYRDFFVLTTYYLAQALITFGVISYIQRS